MTGPGVHELLLLAARTTGDGIQVLDIPGQGTFELSAAESPRFVSRAVASLAADPDALSLSSPGAAHPGTRGTLRRH